MNFAHCLHIVLVIGKYTDVSRRDLFGGEGVGGGLRGRILQCRMCPWGKGYFYEGGAEFTSII